MSDYKLYTINLLSRPTNDLSEIKLSADNDYVIETDDFTNKFAKINSEYYEIVDNVLYKIPVIAKNSQNIITIETRTNKYIVYVNFGDNLVVFNFADTTNTILCSDVETMLQCAEITDSFNIVYKKNNISQIICSTYNDNLVHVKDNIIDYEDCVIIKVVGSYFLNSNNNLYVPCFRIRSSGCLLCKKIGKIFDFNVYRHIFNNYVRVYKEFILVLNSQKKIQEYDRDNNKILHIDNDGYLKKKIYNVKSAAVRS
jgi:hypothetical protein